MRSNQSAYWGSRDLVMKCAREYRTCARNELMINYIGAACSVILNYRSGVVPDAQAFVLALWLFRYLRRREAFVGGLGEGDSLTDKVARDLLSARNRAEDHVVSTLPDWDPSVHDLARRWLGNAHHGKHLDVKNLTEPHGYGPSLRRLWVEARNHGHDPWGIITGWALHMPKSFQGYDPDQFFERWKKGPEKALQAEMSPQENKQVSRVLIKNIEWRTTGDLDIPWTAEDRRHAYRVRLNDFPDEWMYTLFVDGTEAGDFHDWPDTWKRGPLKPPTARKRTASAQPAVEIDPDRLLTRYLDGDHESVWSDLESLRERVREPRYLGPARAVARETMQRARRNIETIVERLHQMNYRFSVFESQAVQRGGQPFVPSAVAAVEQLRKLEREGMVLPLSLEAWVEQVGSVNLMGAHAKLCFLGNEDDFPYLFADPLMLEVPLSQIAGADAADGVDCVLALDEEGKAGGAALHPGYYQPDYYFVRLPDLQADTKLRGERHKISFVSYLRLAFRWGGFPGWEQYDDPPQSELAALTAGLLTI